jgi:integrase
MTESSPKELLARAARLANLRNNGPHILRHTFCSHLAMRGRPPNMHLSPAAIRSAIQLLEQPAPTIVRGDIVETAEREIANVKG